MCTNAAKHIQVFSVVTMVADSGRAGKAQERIEHELVCTMIENWDYVKGFSAACLLHPGDKWCEFLTLEVYPV